MPLLAPLLAVLLVAALNPRPPISVRILTSRSPVLPLGVWLAAGAAGGAALSGLATALALRDGRRLPRRRADGPSRRSTEPWFRAAWPRRGSSGSEWEFDAAPPPAAEPDGWSQAAPQRAPGEPPPTVSVPFRVLRRPQRSSPPTTAAATAAGGVESAAAAAAMRHDAAAAEDWDTMADEDW